jgi:hypothetical protein
MPKLSLAKLERHLYSAADRLRQEGLDAATYKDYIFGMLFLKRCSDVFDAERENIVGRKIEQGMVKEAAETQYGENPDFYDGFFVPERARWTYLQSKLSDASEPFGSVLDKALGALSEYNESLEHVLDRFKLAGVIATWWTDTLPDFKTLLENGFPGVIDGWVDAIADAVEDDEAAGPAFDPFGHKLVRRTMADYLERIAAAKADIARLKGEKEAFEQSNAPDDADEEELANWNYAKDLECQARELKAEHKDALKELAKLEKAAAKTHATKNNPSPHHARTGTSFSPSPGGRELEGGGPLHAAKTALQPALDQLAALEAALTPYEQIKTDLATARARYRELTNAFVDELKSRCGAMSDDQKRALVLELFAQDVQTGLDAAVAEKRQELMRFVEGLWDKYRVTLTDLLTGRVRVPEHSGVRRHDAASSSRTHEPASGPPRPETAHESGDTSPHSKGDAP